jgi:hypothetical protein
MLLYDRADFPALEQRLEELGFERVSPRKALPEPGSESLRYRRPGYRPQVVISIGADDISGGLRIGVTDIDDDERFSHEELIEALAVSGAVEHAIRDAYARVQCARSGSSPVDSTVRGLVSRFNPFTGGTRVLVRPIDGRCQVRVEAENGAAVPELVCRFRDGRSDSIEASGWHVFRTRYVFTAATTYRFTTASGDTLEVEHPALAVSSSEEHDR